MLSQKVTLANQWLVGLFTNSPFLSPNSVLADFTEYAPPGGYARQSPAIFGPPLFDNATNLPVCFSRQMKWGPTLGLPVLINGWFAVDELGNLAAAAYVNRLAPPFLGGPQVFLLTIGLYDSNLVL